MKRWTFLLLLSCGAIAMSNCGRRLNPFEPGGEVIIPSTTKAISAADFNNQLVAVSPDSATFIFREGTKAIDDLQVNDIMVSERGLGALRKISAVTRANGQMTVRTAKTTLTEAIQRGSASMTRALSPDDTLKTLYRAPGLSLKKSQKIAGGFFYALEDVVIYDDDGDEETADDQIVANGRIEISPSFTFSLNIDDWKLKDLTISTAFTEDKTLDFEMSLLGINYQKEKEIFRAQMNPMTFFIGWVPVVITPVLSIKVGVDGRIYAGLSSSISQHAEFTTGLTYHNNKWTPFANQTFSFEVQPPALTAGAALKGYLGPGLDFLLYGVVGPTAALSLYGKIDAEISRRPWLIVYGGIEVNMGVEVEILSHFIAGYHAKVLDLNVKLYESADLPGGKILGSVKDASNNVPIAAAKIDIYQSASLVATAFSNSNGIYEASVPANDNYKVIFSKTGYLNADYQNVKVVVGENTVLETVLQINQNHSGAGTISGTIKNALDGSGVSGVSLKLRPGINVTTGPVISTTTTNSSGYYALTNVQAGNYTMEAGRSGFNTTFFSVLCLGGQTIDNQNATLSPVLTTGETRIVLTWGANPRDLDSHFTGPLPDGTRFHMYFPLRGSRSKWPTIVNLDLDDTSSYGPETTTLYQQRSGIYRFSVHDYTNRESSSSFALSNSSAQVRIYQSSGLVASFNVPPNTGGTLWAVFEMSGNTITPINAMSYVSNEDAVRKSANPELALFRHLPVK